MCLVYYNVLMDTHYSKYICDLFLNKSNIEEKKIVLATLLKNKNNINLTDNNKSVNNRKINKQGI